MDQSKYSGWRPQILTLGENSNYKLLFLNNYKFTCCCKKWYSEIPHNIYTVSHNGNNLQNYGIVSQQDIDIATVKTQNSSITKGMLCCPFETTPTLTPDYHLSVPWFCNLLM